MAVLETDGQDNILIATHDGMAICFRESDVRPMGRTAVGVRGIKPGKGTLSSVGCGPSPTPPSSPSPSTAMASAPPLRSSSAPAGNPSTGVVTA